MTVVLYDLKGRVLSTVIDRRLDAGSYRRFIDTRNFARGCYAVRFRAGTAVSIETVLLSGDR